MIFENVAVVQVHCVYPECTHVPMSTKFLTTNKKNILATTTKHCFPMQDTGRGTKCHLTV